MGRSHEDGNGKRGDGHDQPSLLFLVSSFCPAMFPASLFFFCSLWTIALLLGQGLPVAYQWAQSRGIQTFDHPLYGVPIIHIVSRVSDDSLDLHIPDA